LTFIPFDVPGADVESTEANDINNKDVVVGDFEGTDANEHGFVRFKNGAISRFDVPGATNTEVDGINDLGTIVGSFTDAGDNVHCFICTNFCKNPGAFTQVDVKIGNKTACSTECHGINNKGEIVGDFELRDDDGDCDDPDTMLDLGFYRSPSGQFSIVKVPDNKKFSADETEARGINEKSEIVGDWENDEGPTDRGFLLASPFGIPTYTAIDPLAGPPTGDEDNGSYGINDSDFICGTVIDGSGLTSAYVRSPGGFYLIFNFPTATDDTECNGINNKSKIVGEFNSGGSKHAYIAQ
jgi:hypothetical protein